ncbi:hypothetical protein D3C71_1693620 [compost metagenome]
MAVTVCCDTNLSSATNCARIVAMEATLEAVARASWSFTSLIDSFRPSLRSWIEPLLPRMALEAVSNLAASPSAEVMMRLTSAGLPVNALSSLVWSSFSWPVFGSVEMPRSPSDRSVPSVVITCRALDMDDWMPRVVPSPVRAWFVCAVMSKAVYLVIVDCSEL